MVSHVFPVALARGKHLFPFRTEKLSPSAPMVLGSQGPGRVGRRRFIYAHEPPTGRLVALLWPRDQRPFATGGFLTTPPRAHHPRKTAPAKGNRATLRRELARRQDTSTPVLPPPHFPGAAHRAGSAIPSCADAPARHRSYGHPSRSRRPRTAPATQYALLARPPSRKHRRPRATRTRARAAASAPAVAALRVCAMNRTCVRTVARPSDSTYANRCLCTRLRASRARGWLVHAGSATIVLQRKLRMDRSLGLAWHLSAGLRRRCSN